MPSERQKAAIIFLSGGGSNAEKLIESVQNRQDASWYPAALVTDAPETSRAREIGATWNLPVVELDIRKFYRERGETRMTLKTELGRQIREEWTNRLREMIKPYAPDFGILAGFVPLTNITADFPCLNVHPGDLTVEDEQGRRILVGLHTLPIETAILAGLTSLRSSVIIAQTYTGKGGEMDSGPILGISPPVKIDFKDYSLDQLKDIAAVRPEKRPVGGWKDELENLAADNQDLLKENGDWVVFPPAVSDYAAGKFKIADDDRLFYDVDGNLREIKTVEYDGSSAKPQII